MILLLPISFTQVVQNMNVMFKVVITVASAWSLNMVCCKIITKDHDISQNNAWQILFKTEGWEQFRRCCALVCNISWPQWSLFIRMPKKMKTKWTETMICTTHRNTLKFLINMVPCNKESDTTWSRRGPAFQLPVDKGENHN